MVELAAQEELLLSVHYFRLPAALGGLAALQPQALQFRWLGGEPRQVLVQVAMAVALLALHGACLEWEDLLLSAHQVDTAALAMAAAAVGRHLPDMAAAAAVAGLLTVPVRLHREARADLVQQGL